MSKINKDTFKKWLVSVIKETIEEEAIKESTTTGNVAGFSTPFAFTRNKKGNESAAKASGYKVVDRDYEDADPMEESKQIVTEGVVGDPFLGRKTSNMLAEINRMMSMVETLLDRRKNPRNSGVMKENAFAKRTPKDISDIKERCGRIITKFSQLSATPGTETLVKEASTPTLEPRNFDISNGYENFQNDLSKLVSGYENLYNQTLKGKEVTIRASKGFGQIKKDYKIIASSVTLSIVKDEYQLVMKDKNQKDYYLDTTFKIVISGQEQNKVEDKPIQSEKPQGEPAQQSQPQTDQSQVTPPEKTQP